jgi:hypothetical protein
MIHNIIINIRQKLTTVFTEVDEWFDVPNELKVYRPSNGGWTIAQILEHITLTNFYLLKLIDKGADKALRNINNLNLEEELANYQFETEALKEIGMNQSFLWIRPEHMEPKGERTLQEVRFELSEQKKRCLQHLDNLPNGEGILYRTTMTVNNLGKIDVYQYIYFLAMHAQRHVQQMRRNKEEFEEKAPNSFPVEKPQHT